MTFKNHSYLVYILLAFIALGCKDKTLEAETSTDVATEKTRKPNIVFIYTDDLG